MQDIGWDKSKHFRLNYIACKMFGKTDDEIAGSLGMSRKSLYRWKLKCGLVGYPRVCKNKAGLTQEQLRTAVKNGISRRVAFQRVNRYGWRKIDAISVPLQKRRRWEDY
jgi:DNA-binding XRE family transcriptional regulator